MSSSLFLWVCLDLILLSVECHPSCRPRGVISPLRVHGEEKGKQLERWTAEMPSLQRTCGWQKYCWHFGPALCSPQTWVIVPYPCETGQRHLAHASSLSYTLNTKHPPVQIHVCICSKRVREKRMLPHHPWHLCLQSKWLEFLSDESPQVLRKVSIYNDQNVQFHFK